MMKMASLVVLGCLLGVPATASPLMQAGNIAWEAANTDDLVLVKKQSTARPHGWSQGRKVGWHGGRVPPGHQKKRSR
jgi:hypothetical protein